MNPLDKIAVLNRVIASIFLLFLLFVLWKNRETPEKLRARNKVCQKILDEQKRHRVFKIEHYK